MFTSARACVLATSSASASAVSRSPLPSAAPRNGAVLSCARAHACVYAVRPTRRLSSGVTRDSKKMRRGKLGWEVS
eukprot:6205119-Pleurochrysis_carterae.AAC.1